MDIYLDEWVYELLKAVERTKARRVLVDSLMDLRTTARDQTRFLEFMYSLTQRFARQGISLLTTCEMPGFLSADNLPQAAVSHLSDNVIMLNQHQGGGSLNRSLVIVKTRASNHDQAVSQFSIGPHGISLGHVTTPGGEPPAGHHGTAAPDSHHSGSN